ncbi:hypothetical protein ACWGH2_37325 [Streptomyces sp. NPDC054871]
MVRAKADYEGPLNARSLPSKCVIYRVPGEDKTEELFTLSVASGGVRGAPLHEVGEEALDPFYVAPAGFGGKQKSDVTASAAHAEPRPIGDGTLGRYTDIQTTVRVTCGPRSRVAAPSLLNVTARANYEDVSANDRQRLARIAHAAAVKLAERTGCVARLPALPDQLGPASPALHPAQTAQGSCRWFADHLHAQGQGLLPNRALGAPAPRGNLVETCLMAVSPTQVNKVMPHVKTENRTYARLAPWWLRTASFVGPEADTVASRGLLHRAKIRPGTAGGNVDNVWWASSVCDGKPALHTLTSSYTYTEALNPTAISALFRAYVNDFTKRRGCTDVTLPDAKDFGAS